MYLDKQTPGFITDEVVELDTTGLNVVIYYIVMHIVAKFHDLGELWRTLTTTFSFLLDGCDSKVVN